MVWSAKLQIKRQKETSVADYFLKYNKVEDLESLPSPFLRSIS